MERFGLFYEVTLLVHQCVLPPPFSTKATQSISVSDAALYTKGSFRLQFRWQRGQSSACEAGLLVPTEESTLPDTRHCYDLDEANKAYGDRGSTLTVL